MSLSIILCFFFFFFANVFVFCEKANRGVCLCDGMLSFPLSAWCVPCVGVRRAATTAPAAPD